MTKGKYYFWLDPCLKRRFAGFCLSSEKTQSGALEEAIQFYLASQEKKSGHPQEQVRA